MTLPAEWGMPLGWSLTFIPILIIIGGLLFHLLWNGRGMPFMMVSLILVYDLNLFIKMIQIIGQNRFFEKIDFFFQIMFLMEI